jgi:hypothetical protein
MTDKTNEPAFPLQDASTHQFCGISIRDYFAAKAMQGMFASDAVGFYNDYAKAAYEMADAMIEARK